MEKKKFLVVFIFILTLVLASCGNRESKEIIGIEPGAGVMQATNKALEEYENLADWKLIESSSAAMASELEKAIKKEKPIVVTGWSPHWKFAKFDLKFLDDPKGIYGEAESIETFARKGLKDDLPGAYTVLDNFYWEASDMEEVMVAIHDGADPEEAAEKWIENNSDKVAKWVEGAEKGNGEKVTLVYVAWDTEIASTHVIGKVLENHGYDVVLRQLDAGPMFTAIANGDADAMVAAWLPLTHASYLEEYGSQMESLGVNLEGAKTGLVVPSYMDVNSIEDLK